MYQKIKTTFAAAALLGGAAASALAYPDRVISLPGYAKPLTEQYSGYVTLSSNAESPAMYYYLVRADHATPATPVILWLNGGPGASSFYGFFTENGPYTLDAKLKLHDNPSGWNHKFNYLIFDQPLGVGYSAPKKGYTLKNQAQATHELYLALQAIYLKYPDLRQRKLFIAGESYAGRYIPEVAIEILQHNFLAQQPSIPLAGIILGDAWVNPLLQQAQDAAYAYSHGLIDRQGAVAVTRLYKRCAQAIQATAITTRAANRECGKISAYIAKKSGVDLHNLHNLPQALNKYATDYANLERYLNLSTVKHSLHVASGVKFSLGSPTVANNLEIGEQNSVESLIPQLLKRQVKALIYTGLEDAKDCNFLGTNLWLKDMHWGNFNQAPQKITYNSAGEIIGYSTNYRNLSYVKLFSAGHMAAQDQAQNCLEVIQKFIGN